MSEILTVQDVCEYLKIAKPALYRYVRSGELPGFKMGKMWKFDRQAIDNWVQTKLVEDTETRSKGAKKKNRKTA